MEGPEGWGHRAFQIETRQEQEARQPEGTTCVWGPLRSPSDHSITDMGVVQTRRLEGEAKCEREPPIRSSFVGQLHPEANQSTERFKRRGMVEEVKATHVRLWTTDKQDAVLTHNGI